MPRSLTPSRSAIPAIDTPRFRRLLIPISRSAFLRRAILRAAGQRSRRMATGSTGSDKVGSQLGVHREQI